MRHSSTELAAFQNGEQRLIFARLEPGDPTALVELPDGEARAWKAQPLNDQVRCPIPSCPAPRLTIYARHPRRRDGFGHGRNTATGHAPESLFHIQAKARVVAWAREHHPDHRVVPEDPSDASRTRIADVMIYAADGQRWAVEIQYASLTPEDWRRRHDSYRRMGINDIWLFGHHGAQLRVSQARDEAYVRLTPTQELMRKLGLPVLWINPFTAQLGIAVEHAAGEPLGRERPGRSGGRLRLVGLEDVRLGRDGLESQLFTDLAAGERQHDSFLAAEAARAEAERLARAQAAARAAERQRAVDAAKAERERVAMAERARVESEWFGSASERRMLAAFNGDLPRWITEADGVWVGQPTERWRSSVWLLGISKAAPGTQVSVAGIVRSLMGWYPTMEPFQRLLLASVERWFELLRRDDLMAKRPGRYGYTRDHEPWIRTDPVAVAQARAEREAAQARRAVEQAVLAEENRKLDERLYAEARRAQEARIQEIHRRREWPVCAAPGCGRIVDPSLPGGVHITCPVPQPMLWS